MIHPPPPSQHYFYRLMHADRWRLDLQVIQPALVVAAVFARLTVSALIVSRQLEDRAGVFTLLRIALLHFSFSLHGHIVSVLLVDRFAVVGAIGGARLCHGVL